MPERNAVDQHALLDYEEEHVARVRAGLAECMVLLRADGTFPLHNPCKLAAYGNGVRHSVKGGTGSGDVNAHVVVNVEQGLRNAGFELVGDWWLDEYDARRVKAKKAFYRRLRREAKAAGKNVVFYSLGAIMPEGECGDFTSALMELGETVCTPGTPECGSCPLHALCTAHTAKEETRYPVLPAKKPRRVEDRRVLVMLCGDKVALRRRPERGLLAGLWEFPNDTLPGAPEKGEPCGETVHVFSHVEWHMRGYLLRCDAETPGFAWVTPEERRALAIPSAFRYFTKLLEDMGL